MNAMTRWPGGRTGWLLGILLLLAAGSGRAAAGGEKVFTATPGTNTLLEIRNAVRAWRTAGHPDAPAVIRLAAGQYYLSEPLCLAAGDSHTTWEARRAGQVTISGGRRITGFTVDAEGLWRTRPGFHFEQLYVDGHRAGRVRWPAEELEKILKVQEVKQPGDRAWLTVWVAPEAVAGLPEEPAALPGVELLVFHKWDTSRYAVRSVDRAAGTITVEGAAMTPWNPWSAGSRFRLENTGGRLIRQGWWSLEASGELVYRPRPGERPDRVEMVAPALERLLVVDGAAAVRLSGLKFEAAAFVLPAAGDPPNQAAVQVGAALELDGARDCWLEDCTVAHTGNYAVWFRRGCHGGGLRHCWLTDLGAGGVRIGEMQIRDDAAEQTRGVVVENNIISGGGRVHPSAVGIWIGQSADNRLVHNDISDLYYTGISVGWTWGYGRSLATNNYLGYNRIHRIGQAVLSDMGGIYTLGVSPGSVEEGNVIFDVRAHDYGGWGIYTDEGSSDWLITSNLVWDCTCVNPASGGAFHQHYGANNRLVNNVFAFSSGPPLQSTRAEDHRSFTLERNLVLAGDTPFLVGAWPKLQFDGGSNCFATTNLAGRRFPGGDLAAWQRAGHEAGSVVTNLAVRGEWPLVRLPRRLATGFRGFDPAAAGVTGDGAWRRLAAEPAAGPNPGF